MAKKHGILVHKHNSADGDIEVVDEGAIRSLYLGSDALQSAMDRNRPNHLHLSYTRAMMSCLLFKPLPQRILVIGLGGGSIVRFLTHYFPNCQLDIVEQRQDVVHVAADYFDVHATPKVCIFAQDANDFFSHASSTTSTTYDVIIIDAYDDKGLAPAIASADFFSRVKMKLTRDGLTSINLWGSQPKNFHQALSRLKESFNNQTLELPVTGKGNVIVLAFHAPITKKQLKPFTQTAKKLEKQTGVEFPQLLRDLLRRNRDPWWLRLIKKF